MTRHVYISRIKAVLAAAGIGIGTMFAFTGGAEARQPCYAPNKWINGHCVYPRVVDPALHGRPRAQSPRGQGVRQQTPKPRAILSRPNYVPHITLLR